MKRTILWAAMIAIFTAEGAAAQTSDASSNANSGSASNSASTSNTLNQPQATANSNQSTTAVSGSSSYGNVGNTTTNTMTPRANSNANSQTASESNSTNAGNSQTIIFNTPAQPVQASSTTSSGRMENVLSGSTSSNVNSNSRSENVISGSTTSNVNSTTRSENLISGEQTVHYEYSGTQTIKNVPSIAAAPLTSSNDTCMGSYSAGLAVPGIGITGGSTYSDEHCKRIKMSRELWNKGMKAASLAIDCMDRDAREALELTGFVCPQTLRDQRAAAAAAAAVAGYQALRSVPAGRATYATYYPPPLPPEALAPTATLAAADPPAQPLALQPALEYAGRPSASPVPVASAQVAVSEIPPPRATLVAAEAPAGENVVVRRVDPQVDAAAPR